LFKAMYESAWLQAAVGLRGASADRPAVRPRDEVFEALVTQKVAALRARMDQGGLREAAVRILIYAGSDEPRVDVRGFRMAERVRDQHFGGERLPGSQRRELVRDQFFLLLLDETEALAALPRMLPSANDRTRALDMVRQVLSAKGELTDERRARLARVEAILNGPSAVAGWEDGGMAEVVPRAESRGSGKYERLLERCRGMAPVPTAVAHPCDDASLGAAVEAARAGIIAPILVGRADRIRAVGQAAGLDLGKYEIVDAPHSHAAATKAVELVRLGRAELLGKGSLNTDELMAEVVRRETGLRTDRRVSHVFVMDVPTYHKPLLVTDAAVNIFPTLDDKRDIIQNAVDFARALGIDRPKVAILSAVETVTSKIPSTIDAAALCKMADRGQIQGAVLDGPLAFDNAISVEAARTKGIASEVAGDPDVVVVPDLEAGNMLAKNLTFLSRADAAGGSGRAAGPRPP